MGAQLSLKAALSLAERIVTASDRFSKAEPRAAIHWMVSEVLEVLVSLEAGICVETETK